RRARRLEARDGEVERRLHHRLGPDGGVRGKAGGHEQQPYPADLAHAAFSEISAPALWRAASGEGRGFSRLPPPRTDAARGPDARAILMERRGDGGAPSGPRVRPAGSPGVLGASRQLSGRGRLPRLSVKK